MAFSNLFKRLSLWSILFNVFSMLFAGFMALDFFEVQIDFLGLTSLALAGVFLLLAVLTLIIHRFYGPGR